MQDMKTDVSGGPCLANIGSFGTPTPKHGHQAGLLLRMAITLVVSPGAYGHQAVFLSFSKAMSAILGCEQARTRASHLLMLLQVAVLGYIALWVVMNLIL